MSGRTAVMFFTGIIVAIVLSALAEAIVLFGAFEDMRGRRGGPDCIDEGRTEPDSFPSWAWQFWSDSSADLSAILLVFPAFIVMTMLFVAMPACIVEQLGPMQQPETQRAADQGTSLEDFRTLAFGHGYRRRS